MAKSTGLGKGLDALFGNVQVPVEEEKRDGEVVEQIPITSIEPNKEQARKKFDLEKLEELANSIKEYGIIQPIIVTKKGDYYEIIAGERRWRAAKMAGLKTIPCLVREEEKQKNMEISLIENIQRQDLNPIEKARGLRMILDTYGLTQQELADKIGMSRSGLTNNVRILNLDPRVIALVEEYNLTERHCRALLRIQDPDKQYKMAIKIVENNESIADTERKVENKVKLPKDTAKAIRYQAIYNDIENSFQSFFGTKVKLEAGKRKGKIVIEYASNDDLERILKLIK
jgi:ParB family chromosome partitioning protein